MSGSSVGAGGHAPLFTVAQWAEMEHQALIFKYLKAGVPVPSELLAPIRTSFNLISPNFLPHHPTWGYASYCGKKIDPEPGRCRRTDGKKWRCSKDAYQDSKYCERHMNRGRNRSRKLVESQTASQSLSTVTSDSVIGGSSHSASFQSMPLHSIGNSGGLCFGGNGSELKMEAIPYGVSNRGTRGCNTAGSEEHNFMSEAKRCVQAHSTVDSPWRLMEPHVPLKSELRNSSLWLNNSSQLQTLQTMESLSDAAAITKQEYVGGEFGLPGSQKHEQNSLQPLFDEWPKSRDLGFHLNDHRSNTTELSMSNAGATPKYCTRSAESPNDAYT
ncbi:growth-regulating factor 5-like [Malus sylvestris]|uniref:growth-regulating factor 5-like n=1 Tax=Malus domestica TaxID=3750 RepID=UPI0021AC4F3A|nr:growth-regulating factor 5-like [Malus sylvestris]XP_050153007.1 growth-regulating factor 5-like [Malus sylvestris]